jgi:hypothetical protein
MRIVIVVVVLLLAGSAAGQSLFTAQKESYPREAESMLIASCRVVGERLRIPMPNPRVELRLGAREDAVESDGKVHVILLQRWNKALFKRAAVHVCMRNAELELVFSLAAKVPDY